MSREILVLNAGSSSVKAGVFAARGGAVDAVARGSASGVGTPHPEATWSFHDESARLADGPISTGTRSDSKWSSAGEPHTLPEAIRYLLETYRDEHPGWAPAAVGHRVVHGGMRFAAPVTVDGPVRADLEALVPLAPLHQPANLAGIDAAAAAFPGVPQVACFDTAFHHGRGFASEAFALPRHFYDEGVRRYGFHGISYEYVARRLREVAPEVAGGRVVVAHLGNGASVCAMHNGRCVETSMGFTALDGLVMGTRPGALDPGVLLHLLAEKRMTADDLTRLLYHECGLKGVSGVGSDMRDLLDSADPRAADAVEMFVRRLVGFVGQYAAVLGGLDALVFTAGIGEHSPAIRETVCRGLGWLGLDFDPAANGAHGPRITAAGSKVSAWVVPTDEERMIAAHAAEVLGL